MENLANFLGLKHRCIPPRDRRRFKSECRQCGSEGGRWILCLPQVQLSPVGRGGSSCSAPCQFEWCSFLYRSWTSALNHGAQANWRYCQSAGSAVGNGEGLRLKGGVLRWTGS